MSEQEQISRGFSAERITTLAKRALTNKNLGPYDLIDPTDPVQREELVLALFSEYMVKLRPSLEVKTARAEIGAGFAEGQSNAHLRTMFNNAKELGNVAASTVFSDAVYEVVKLGGKQLREQLDSGEEVPSKPLSEEAKLRAKEVARHDEMVDTEMLLKELARTNVVSPGHVASLLVYLGYARARDGVDPTKYIVMARNDLRTRLSIHPVSAMIDEKKDETKQIIHNHVYDLNKTGTPFTTKDNHLHEAVNALLVELLKLDVPFGSTISR